VIVYRRVQLSELDAFSSIGDAETARVYRTYLLDSLRAGETSPDRWFAAVDGEDIIGRIVFWSLPQSAEVSLDVYALPWANDACAAFAPDFLQTAIDAVRASGVRAVEYEHHEPDPDAHTPMRLLATLTAAGFEVVRRTVRFELSPVIATPHHGQVQFEGYSDGVSEDDFVDVVARCAAVGQDTGVSSRHAEDRVELAAAQFIDATRAMRGGTQMWRIARLGDETVGVILPTANDGGPVLNYIGVVPARRGQHLAGELLAEAVRLHARAGAKRMRADSDEGNVRMHAAFVRAGWRAFGRRTTYRLDLDS
jgi:GNAT superfamily N-acetyltransferase